VHPKLARHIQYLLSQGADVNVENNKGDIPLVLAVQYTCPASPRYQVAFRIVQILIGSGADVNVINRYGQTPLGTAAHWCAQHSQIFDYLVSKGADVNAKDEQGRTQLHRGVFGTGLTMFLANGADINAKDNDGKTPLHWQVANVGHPTGSEGHRPGSIYYFPPYYSGIAWFIANGADVNAKDNQGKTPIDIVKDEIESAPLDIGRRYAETVLEILEGRYTLEDMERGRSGLGPNNSSGASAQDED
jgi:ankyrin repeat protein